MTNKNGNSYYEITGDTKLKGSVKISGSKNASLPIIAASLLTPDEVVLNNVPNLRDIQTMMVVLDELGAKVTYENGTMVINSRDVSNFETRFEVMNRMRASIYVMGPLLARFGRARAAVPGGCAIGSRPVNYHLAGFEKMGVSIKNDHGYMDATCNKLEGARLHLDFPSVGATSNLMMAGVLAEGTTIIENAAEEPHIQDLAWFLKSIGARIQGAGTKTITINGVSKLHGTTHSMIPDQIEAGTFMLAAAITRGNVTVENIQIKDLRPVIVKLEEAGISIKEFRNAIKVSAKKKILPLNITTLPHPGFPTDMQPQMMAMLTTADGVSIIKETVWENRFMHVAELARMGAKINVQGNTCIIVGTNKLSGSRVISTDLRAGAALVLSGIAADNHTKVYDIFHIDRGYENFESKLAGLGAQIKRVDVPDSDD
ncbi:MAG TPA: UDP-N-acetylglucosamine 1-carboxyvinyltransferase [bacterium]|nr:UDP-N-acetylglucosamine 1-carboxyvinyltransferase [bacterium]